MFIFLSFLHILLSVGHLHVFCWEGFLMFLENEDDLQEEDHDDDEGRELKTISIAEYVKMRREKRKKEQKEFEDKLKVLKEKIDRLKKELDDE